MKTLNRISSLVLLSFAFGLAACNGLEGSFKALSLRTPFDVPTVEAPPAPESNSGGESTRPASSDCPAPIWVDANYGGANGTSNGSASRPYTTTAQMAAALKDGACFTLRGGVYEALSGLTINKNDVTIAGVKGEEVHWTTARKLTGWSVHQTLGGGVTVYKLNVGATEISDLLVDFASAQLAHYPQEGWLEVPATVVKGSTPTKVQGSTSYYPFTVTDARLSALTDLSGATLNVKVYATNTTARYRIASHNGSVITTEGTTADFAAGDRYVLANTLETIQDGQWAQKWDSAAGAFVVYFATSNSSLLDKLRGSNFLKSGFTIGSAIRNATIRNLIITGAGWGIYTFGKGTTITDNIFTSLSHGVFLRGIKPQTTPTVVAEDPATGTLIKNNLFIRLVGPQAIIQDGPITNTTVTQNEIAYSIGDGMSFGGGNIVGLNISKNYIHHYNQQVVHADGFQIVFGTAASRMPSSNVVIDSNYIWIGGQHFGLGVANSGHEVRNNVMMNAVAFSTLNGAVEAGTENIYSHNTYALNQFGPYNAFKAANFRLLDNVYDLYNGTYTAFLTNNAATLAACDYNFYHTASAAAAFFVYDSAVYSGNPGSGPAAFSAAHGFETNGQLSASATPIFANMPLVSSSLVDKAAIIAGYTRTSVAISKRTGFNVGDYIEINADGVLRQITALNASVAGAPSAATITFTPALPMIPFTPDTMVDNWGPTAPSSLQRDVSIVTSGAQTMSSTGGRPGAALDLAKIQNGILDGGSTRTLPVLPASLAAVKPDPNKWSAYLYVSPKP